MAKSKRNTHTTLAELKQAIPKTWNCQNAVPPDGPVAEEKLEVVIRTVVPTHYKLWGCEGLGKPHTVLWSGKALEGGDYVKAVCEAARLYRWHIAGYDDHGASKIIPREDEVFKLFVPA